MNTGSLSKLVSHVCDVFACALVARGGVLLCCPLAVEVPLQKSQCFLLLRVCLFGRRFGVKVIKSN